MSDFDRVKAAYDEVALARRGGALSPPAQGPNQVGPARSRGGSEMSAIIVERGTPAVSAAVPGRLTSAPNYTSPIMGSPETQALLTNNDQKIIQSSPVSSVSQGQQFKSQAVFNPFQSQTLPSRQTSGLGEAVIIGGNITRNETEVYSSVPASQTYIQPYIQQSSPAVRPEERGMGKSVVIGGNNAKAESGYPAPTVGSPLAINNDRPSVGIGGAAKVNWNTKQDYGTRTAIEVAPYRSESGSRPGRMKSAVGTLDAQLNRQDDREYQPSVQVATRPYKSTVPDYMQSFDPDRTLPPANWKPPSSRLEYERPPPEVVPEPIVSNGHHHTNDLDSMDAESLREELEKLKKENIRWKEYDRAADTETAKSIAYKISEVRSWGIAEYNNLMRKRDSLEYDTQGIQNKYDRLKKDLSDEEFKQKRLEYEVRQAQNDIQVREERISRARQDVVEMKNGCDNLKREIQRAQQDNPYSEGKIRNVTLEQERLRERIAQLRQQLRGNGELQERLTFAREQRIEDEIAIMQRANRALEIEIDTFRMGTYLEQPPPLLPPNPDSDPVDELLR